MKKEIIRTCVGCRKEHSKIDMIRIVRGKDKVQLDFSGKLNGRGAYICNSKECLSKAVKTNSLQKALNCDIDDKVIEQLKKEINNAR